MKFEFKDEENKCYSFRDVAIYGFKTIETYPEETEITLYTKVGNFNFKVDNFSLDWLDRSLGCF